MNTPRVLMKDVAKKAGVHQTTVSLALRNHSSLPKATRERIQTLAAEMGYRPDPALSALLAYRQATKSKPPQHAIAWIVNAKDPQSLAAHHAHKPLVEGGQARAEALGYRLDSLWKGRDYHDCRSLNRILRSRNIQGLVLESADGEPLDLDWDLFAAVTLDKPPARHSIDAILPNQSEAVAIAIAELRKIGLRRIGLALADRHRELRQATFPDCHVATFHFEPSEPYREKLLAWARANRLEAIASDCNELDQIAASLNREGQPCRFFPLDADERTSKNGGVKQDHRERGSRAIDMLVGHIKTSRRGPERSPTTTLVTPKLIPIPATCPHRAALEPETLAAL